LERVEENEEESAATVEEESEDLVGAETNKKG
jgi:hypothetical protein